VQLGLETRIESDLASWHERQRHSIVQKPFQVKQNCLLRIGQRFIQCIACRETARQIRDDDPVCVFGVTGFNRNGISHKITSLLQTSLLENREYQAFTQIFLGMWHRDRAHFCLMDKLMVAAAGTLQAPPSACNSLISSRLCIVCITHTIDALANDSSSAIGTEQRMSQIGP
jgi:hypothetical protein